MTKKSAARLKRDHPDPVFTTPTKPPVCGNRSWLSATTTCELPWQHNGRHKAPRRIEQPEWSHTGEKP